MESEETKNSTLKIICPRCNATGTVPWEQMKGGKVQLRCPVCRENFPYFHERRQFFRKAPLPLVRFGAIGVDFEKLPGKGFIVDLSMTGMKMKVDSLPQEQFINLNFQLPPADESVRVSGEVVWVRPVEEGGYQTGVNFTHVDAHAKKQIGFFLMS